MSADRPVRRDESSHTTMPPKYVLVIRAHLCESAVKLFGELLNGTALPRIDTNIRGSSGAARRLVVHDHPIKVFAVHPRAFARIRG